MRGTLPVRQIQKISPGTLQETNCFASSVCSEERISPTVTPHRFFLDGQCSTPTDVKPLQSQALARPLLRRVNFSLSQPDRETRTGENPGEDRCAAPRSRSRRAGRARFNSSPFLSRCWFPPAGAEDGAPHAASLTSGGAVLTEGPPHSPRPASGGRGCRPPAPPSPQPPPGATPSPPLPAAAPPARGAGPPASTASLRPPDGKSRGERLSARLTAGEVS